MKKLLSTILLGIFISTMAFGGIFDFLKREEKKEIEIIYVEWASEVASTNVVKAVLEESLDYDVEITPVSAAAMWQAMGAGDVDAMVAAWLPTTHEAYYNKVKDDVEDLGPNLTGTKLGLVVPSYVEVDSIKELNENADKFDGEIIGIDAGSGIMGMAEQAFDDYDLSNFELVDGSGATMAAALSDAIKNEEPIVVTSWTPHWMFGKWDLKYLEDPEKTFGEAENINTIVRKDLKEDMPDAYTFLDNFKWTPKDMAEVMVAIKNGEEPYESAKNWVKDNEDKVREWLEGIK
ncbi:MAG: glycine betaine ABC transporter substrate-binding protein [Fusobacteriota bacterium]